MRARRILALLLCLVIAAVAAVIIIQKVTDHGNSPPDPGTPVPDPHTGYFESELGSMTFNGDGKSVTIEFDDLIARDTGLPPGKHDAEYYFFLPHLWVLIRKYGNGSRKHHDHRKKHCNKTNSSHSRKPPSYIL